MVDVIKQSGGRSTESFSSEKLLRSIYAACLSVRSPEGEAEDAAREVTAATVEWVSGKSAITTQDIRLFVSKRLQQYHPDAAYYYQHHKNIM